MRAQLPNQSSIVFFLENDIQVRGLEVPTDRCIGYDAFVGLCEEFDNVISWPK
jgi:sulfur transfer complex TusBCD TusB component (DsrH family)